MAALVFMPAMAWDHLYIIGDGTPTGWSLNTPEPIEMDETAPGSNTYVTICYLDNAKGATFRLQPDRDWIEANYYGASYAGEPIGNDETKSLVLGNQEQFKVTTPGVYLIEANLNENKVKINRMDTMYLTGDIENSSWNLTGETQLRNSSDNPDHYWGKVTFNGTDYTHPGYFKFYVEPNRAAGWDNRFFLFKDNKYQFKTDPTGDNRWTVGDPEQADHTEHDLVAGTYNVFVDAAAKAVKFYMHAKSVHIAGPGAMASWGYDTGEMVPLSSTGEGHYLGKHVFFRNNANDNIFKIFVDGKYYGSDTWDVATLGDNSTAYMRVITTGADFKVDAPGFREVKVYPSNAGDGTLALELSGLQSVWFDGICALEYDGNTGSYVNNSGWNWLAAGKSGKAVIDGDEMAELHADKTGWYEASVTFDRWNPSYNLKYQTPSLEGDAVDGSLKFEEQDAEDNRFIRRRVYLTAGGSVKGKIGDRMSDAVNISTTGYYTVTLDMVDNTPRLSVTGPFEAYMPLSETDFKDGRKHYFLVGQRMGAWRLQPEWEFIPQEDGTYAIPTCALYNGYVMVGEVDNYEDYITQTYRGYSHTDLGAESKIDPRNNDQEVTRELPLAFLPSTGKNGCTDGKYTGTRYNDIKRTSPDVQHGSWETMKLRLIHILTPDGYNDVQHIQSLPSRVNKIVLSLDENGHPSNIRFEGLNTSARALAEIRTFSLVGSGIKNHNISYNGANGVTSPLNNQPGYGGSEWCEAWIQYDNAARPYVDGNGEYIYHTSFTRDWLRAHPSYFNFEKDENSSGFEYTSNNITFVYNPDIKHADEFGQRTGIDSGGDERPEVLHTYFRDPVGDESYGRNEYAVNSLNDRLVIPEEDRACYVVEDMWMDGTFKVWCGWGGSATNYEFEDNGTTYTRWFRSNGSHGRSGEDCTAYFQADKILAYTLFEDVPNANFGIGYGLPSSETFENPFVDNNGVINKDYVNQSQRRFFKRVEIWFNLKNGFAYQGADKGGSVIIFYQEESGPNIVIAKTNGNHVNYNFCIPLINMDPAVDERVYGNVVAYRVYRIPVDENGVEGTPVLVADEDLGDGVKRDEFGNVDILDPTSLPAGRYRYMVETKRALTQNTEDKWKSAKSNIIRISPEDIPSGVENVGQDEAADFGLKLASSDGMLRVSANAEIGSLTIYSMNGAMVKRVNVTSNTTTVDISALAAGVYVVNANNHSVRFVKR